MSKSIKQCLTTVRSDAVFSNLENVAVQGNFIREKLLVKAILKMLLLKATLKREKLPVKATNPKNVHAAI